MLASEAELRALVVTQLELVDLAEFEKAQTLAGHLRIPLELALSERCSIPLEFLLRQLAQSWGLGFVDLKVGDVQPEALRAVPEEYARRQRVIPFERDGRDLKLAMWNPRDRAIIGEIEQMTRARVIPYLAPEATIRRAHLLYKGNLRALLERLAAETASHPGGPAERSGVDLCTRILEYAVVARASDIHIEPFEFETLVRYRVDGVLRQVLSLAPTLHAPLVARIKILASMRIDERRLPQDGRLEADLSGVKVDLRASTVPARWGEKVVLRVLSKEAVVVELEDLGLVAGDYETMLGGLARPFGMILVTGPTGSGKSTTLYAMLMRLGIERQHAVNISTIEDPIEYTMPRVTQIQVNSAAGLEFADGLRALLRQDPDIIMVGEIRDRETAEIGVRAALVGRLFLSTLHTNDSTSAVARLTDMGVEPFLLASTLVLVVAQRLVRRICVSCRETVVAGDELLASLRARPDHEQTVRVLQAAGVLGRGEDPLAGSRLFTGKGCPQCNGTGFRGRLGIFELFQIDDQGRRMIMERRDGSSIRAAAVEAGMKTMFQDGLAKALLGETTLEEVFRVAL